MLAARKEVNPCLYQTKKGVIRINIGASPRRNKNENKRAVQRYPIAEVQIKKLNIRTQIESIIWAVRKEAAETKAIGTKIYFLLKGIFSASLK